MRVRSVWVIAIVALVAGACGGSDGDEVAATPTEASTPDQRGATPTPAVDEATPRPTATPEPTPTPTPAPPPTEIVMEVTGEEELVFDWDVDNCEPEHIPDIAARAIRDADGQVQLTIGHYVNYRMVGADLDTVENDCTVLLRSTFDPDPSTFDDSVWLGGLHTLDGETIYAIVHNEYRGDTHDAVRPGQCPSSRRFTCLDTSLTMYVSRDGGDSYQPIAEPPDHMVATLPYVFDDEGLPTGLRQPSNIVSGRDGYFYVFSNISSYPAEEQWVCVMRTDDLEDPRSWRYWDGEAFTGEFVDPYRTDDLPTDTCAPLARAQLDVSVQEAVLWDESIERFVMIGTSHEPGTGGRWGIYFSTSEDLVTWTTRSFVIELASYSSVTDPEVDSFYAYASMIDPDSASLSFDTSDGDMYIYMTRFHAGTSSLDRDLVRFPVRVREVEVEAPEWDFDTEGDTGRWEPTNQVDGFTTTGGSLVMTSTGGDPYIVVPTNFPAAFETLTIRMLVSGDGSTDHAQVFFGTDTSPHHTEEASIVFEIETDGEFHDYVLDMSTMSGWDGTVTSLRLDPGGRPADIEVDRIALE